MGYTTTFEGQVSIEPPLSAAEAGFLRRFAESRRMNREGGPYVTEDVGVLDYNTPPEGQPGLWCQWVPTEDGDALEWDGNEKFYESQEWMAYLIEHFLMPDGKAKDVPGFESFTFDHMVNGTIYAEGEDPDDRWCLDVKDNRVFVRNAEPVTYGEPEPIGRAEENPAAVRAATVAREIIEEFGVPSSREQLEQRLAYAYARGSRDGYGEAADDAIQHLHADQSDESLDDLSDPSNAEIPV